MNRRSIVIGCVVAAIVVVGNVASAVLGPELQDLVHGMHEMHEPANRPYEPVTRPEPVFEPVYEPSYEPPSGGPYEPPVERDTLRVSDTRLSMDVLVEIFEMCAIDTDCIAAEAVKRCYGVPACVEEFKPLLRCVGDAVIVPADIEWDDLSRYAERYEGMVVSIHLFVPKHSMSECGNEDGIVMTNNPFGMGVERQYCVENLHRTDGGEVLRGDRMWVKASVQGTYAELYDQKVPVLKQCPGGP